MQQTHPCAPAEQTVPLASPKQNNYVAKVEKSNGPKDILLFDLFFSCNVIQSTI